MRYGLVLVLGMGVVLGVTGRLAARDQDNPRAIIDKAITAMGGEKKLARYHAVSAEGTGKLYALTEAVDCKVSGAEQMPEKKRIQLELEFQGMNVMFIRIVNGHKGWINQLGSSREMNKDELADARQDVYFDWIATTLVPLRDQAFQLSSLKERKIGGHSAVGVKVSHKGRRDISLYFDRENGLLLKGSMRVKDKQGEVVQDSYFGDYKDVQGVKRAHKRVIKRGGLKYLTVHFTKIKLAEKLGDEDFTQP